MDSVNIVKAGDDVVIDKCVSFQEELANMVIYTLTRDKKLPAPAGIAPITGQSSSESHATDSGSASETAEAINISDDPLASAAAVAAQRMGLSAADLNAIRNASGTLSPEQVSEL